MSIDGIGINLNKVVNYEVAARWFGVTHRQRNQGSFLYFGHLSRCMGCRGVFARERARTDAGRESERDKDGGKESHCACLMTMMIRRSYFGESGTVSRRPEVDQHHH